MLDKIKRLFTGPTYEEMGLSADYGKNHVAVHIDPPVPYKPGTEHAQWPVQPKAPTLFSRAKDWVKATVEAYNQAKNQ